MGYDRLKSFPQQWKLDLDFDDASRTIATEWSKERKKVWIFLKLINGDYLKSSLADNRYEVQSKTRRAI